MTRGRWITPEASASTERVCWRISLPLAVEWVAALRGAIDDLRFSSNWEQLSGIDPDEAAGTWADIFDSIEECRVIGTIFPYILAATPTGALPCAGGVFLRVDYPVLYSLLAAAYKDDADHFHVPDLRGRTVIGNGQGSGLSNRVLGTDLGEETHSLSTAELASHAHGESIAVPSVVTIGTGAPTPAATSSTGTTGSAGSGSAHNNMQPTHVVRYAIWAK